MDRSIGGVAATAQVRAVPESVNELRQALSRNQEGLKALYDRLQPVLGNADPRPKAPIGANQTESRVESLPALLMGLAVEADRQGAIVGEILERLQL